MKNICDLIHFLLLFSVDYENDELLDIPTARHETNSKHEDIMRYNKFLSMYTAMLIGKRKLNKVLNQNEDCIIFDASSTASN